MTKCAWLLNAIREYDSDDCLLWPFYRDKDGYGALSYKGQRVLAHRLVFFLTRDRWPTPEGCHTCDKPSCFNPRHIFEGTHADNSNDAAIKGRMAHKLSVQQIRDIRKTYIRYKRGCSALALANKYGVSHNLIRCIVSRSIWKHIQG